MSFNLIPPQGTEVRPPARSRKLRTKHRELAASRFFRAIVTLSASWHDVGKANAYFSKKIREAVTSGGGGKALADPVRHEIVSAWLLGETLTRGRLIVGGQSIDEKDLLILSDKELTTRLLNEAMVALVETRKDFLNESFMNIGHVMPAPGKERVRNLLVSLIATHHRQFDGRAESDGGHALGHRLHTSPLSSAAERKLNLTFTCKVSDFGARADVSAWLSIMSRSAGAALSALKEMEFQRDEPLDQSIRQAGRFCLILGDQHASKYPSPLVPRGAKTGKTIYANTGKPLDGDDQQDRLKQTLARHLAQVGFATALAARWVQRQSRSLPSLGHRELPKSVAFPTAGADKFKWQADSAAAVKAYAQQGKGDEAGFLGIVMARTGSGKTRAIPTILSAFGPLRYSIGLGLRTLTRQTGDEYRNRIGFSADEVAVLMGGVQLEPEMAVRNERGVEGVETDLDALETVAAGTDAEEQAEIDIVSGDGQRGMGDMPPLVSRCLRNGTLTRRGKPRSQAATLLAAPVLVSTIDMLMAAADPSRTSHLAQEMRVATSDIVIDEIDDFSPEDIVAICRLAEVAGAYGNRLLISSATVSPPIARAVFDSYSAGWKSYCARTGRETRVDCGWFGDFGALPRIETALDSESFPIGHAGVSREMVLETRSQATGRKLEIVDVEAILVDGKPNFFASVLAGCKRAHRLNHVVDPATGARVSVGVVRWSNVSPAWDFARYLAEIEDQTDIDIRVIPYHGNLLSSTRESVERTLDKWLKRHSLAPSDDPVLSPVSPFRKAIDSSKTGNVTIIVVTTSLEDVGRDHDFDWAVCEPGSVRSVVQIGGRVRRHRPIIAGNPNVFLMSKCYKHFKSDSLDHAGYFNFPGPETPFVDGKGEPIKEVLALGEHVARVAYSGLGWEESVDASCVIDPEGAASPLAALERRRLVRFLNEGTGDGITPNGKRRWQGYVTNTESKFRRFRRQAGTEHDLRLQEDGKWSELVCVDKRFDWKPIKVVVNHQVRTDRFIVVMDADSGINGRLRVTTFSKNKRSELKAGDFDLHLGMRI